MSEVASHRAPGRPCGRGLGFEPDAAEGFAEAMVGLVRSGEADAVLLPDRVRGAGA